MKCFPLKVYLIKLFKHSFISGKNWDCKESYTFSKSTSFGGFKYEETFRSGMFFFYSFFFLILK